MILFLMGNLGAVLNRLTDLKRIIGNMDMNKKNALIASLIFSCAAFNVLAAEKCVQHAANRNFMIWDGTCSAHHFFSPVVYSPADSSFRLFPLSENGHGCGGMYYLRDHDDHGDVLFAEEYTGVLKSTPLERFPSGYPMGITTINIETQDQNGRILSCDFKFNRQDNTGTIEVCSSANNPRYCDMQKQGQFLYLLLGGHLIAKDQKEMRQSSRLLLQRTWLHAGQTASDF